MDLTRTTSRKANQNGRQGPKKTITMKHLIIAGVLVGAVFFLWPKQATPSAHATQTDAGCNLADPAHVVSRIVGDTQGCIAELRGSLPAAAGTGQTAYIRFDGNTWAQTGVAIQNPSAKVDAVKVYSSGAIEVHVSIHDAAGTVLYSTGAVRGAAAIMQVDYIDATASGITIEDAERGTYEVGFQ